jgi:gamma-glutamylcysteine synthetase
MNTFKAYSLAKLNMVRGNLYNYLDEDTYNWLIDEAVTHNCQNLGLMIAAIIKDAYNEGFEVRELTAAERYELKFLRKKVDNLEKDLMFNDSNQNVMGKHAVAREELKDFVNNLRKEGVNI